MGSKYIMKDGIPIRTKFKEYLEDRYIDYALVCKKKTLPVVLFHLTNGEGYLISNSIQTVNIDNEDNAMDEYIKVEDEYLLRAYIQLHIASMSSAMDACANDKKFRDDLAHLVVRSCSIKLINDKDEGGCWYEDGRTGPVGN